MKIDFFIRESSNSCQSFDEREVKNILEAIVKLVTCQQSWLISCGPNDLHRCREASCSGPIPQKEGVLEETKIP